MVNFVNIIGNSVVLLWKSSVIDMDIHGELWWNCGIVVNLVNIIGKIRGEIVEYYKKLLNNIGIIIEWAPLSRLIR